MKRKEHSFLRISRSKLPIMLSSFFISTGVLAQTDACGPVGWVNYTNATYAGLPTGGGAASPVTVTTISQLKTEANSTGAKVIYVQGTMGSGYMNGSGERVDVKSDKTIIGYPGAMVYAFFSVKNASNVIIRNLIIQGPGAEDVDGWDNMTIDNSTNIWIDHCDFRDGEDGNADIKNASNNVSITWSKFSYTSITQNRGALNHSFSNLIGSSDDATGDAGKLRVTFQYCWWDGAVERTPRVRYGQVHIANSLFTEVTDQPQSKLGVTDGYNSNVRVENNAFIGINNPIDVGKEDGSAVIQSINNLFSGTSGNTTGSGTAFTPPYSLDLAANTVLNTSTFKNCVGATLTAPPASSCPCGSPLPVELISFDIKPYQNSYLLSWQLAGTETLTELKLEYSGDGEDFSVGHSLNKNYTDFIIPSEDLNANEILYIRLVFFDADGSISYSPVLATENKMGKVIYPNPFTSEIKITGAANGKIVLSALDGKIVYQGIIPETGRIHLDHLPKGSYILSIIDNVNNNIRKIPVVKFQ